MVIATRMFGESFTEACATFLSFTSHTAQHACATITFESSTVATFITSLALFALTSFSASINVTFIIVRLFFAINLQYAASLTQIVIAIFTIVYPFFAFIYCLQPPLLH